MRYVLITWILLITIASIESASILCVFHLPSKSHAFVYRRVVEDLSARGHHLTIVTVYPLGIKHENVTEIILDGAYDRRLLDFGEIRENNYGMLRILYMNIDVVISRTIRRIGHPKLRALINDGPYVMDEAMTHANCSRNESFYDDISTCYKGPVRKKFDLLLLEYQYQTPLLYLAEIFDVPAIAITSLEATNVVHYIFGTPLHPGIYPDIIVPHQPGKMTLFQRIESIFAEIVVNIGHLSSSPIFSLLLKHKYFPNVQKSLQQIENERMQFLLHNGSPLLGATRPVTLNTISLGNIHIVPPKPLEGNLKHLLDESENGVIYVSFGTNVNTKVLNKRFFDAFVNTFAKLNHTVLWKFDDDSVGNMSSNVYTSRWFPQQDVLAHPNVKLFITHSGLLSVEEAIDREVPMIVIPFYVDHFRCAYKVRDEELGVYIKYEDMSEELLFDAVMEVSKLKYKENLRKFRELMYDVPMSPREKAVWWIEYVLRHKYKNIYKDVILNVPFYQVHNLDVLALAALVLWAIVKFGKILLNFVRRARKIKIE